MVNHLKSSFHSNKRSDCFILSYLKVTDMKTDLYTVSVVSHQIQPAAAGKGTQVKKKQNININININRFREKLLM